MLGYRKLIDFSGKNIVVVGGLGLIGHNVCKAFVEFNGKVIIADIDEEKFRMLKDKEYFDSDKYSFVHFDISKPNKVETGIKKILTKYKTIDTWINLAYPRTEDWGKRSVDINFESWNDNVKMHLGGYFFTSELILEHMKGQNKGCLINFGSTYGVAGPHFEIYKDTKMTVAATYSAIKGAIVNLTRHFAALYGPYNIRVNTICPGGVFDQQNPKFVRRYNKLTPLGRMAKSEEIAIPTVFLASEGASYITGHTLMVDGGWTCW